VRLCFGAVPPSRNIQVALLCGPQLLRLGLERILIEDGYTVMAHHEPFSPPERAEVAVVCERGMPDLVARCHESSDSLAEALVVVFSRPQPGLLLECLAAGASGFVAEHDGPAELVRAVEAARTHEYHLSPAMLALLLDWHRSERRPRAERTEERERDLLALLAAGRSTAEIAQALEIAPKTVRNRSSLLYRRLGVRSRAQAARLAEDRGLLD
jgi:DNA-binding NarL/FixJ family response regulator